MNDPWGYIANLGVKHCQWNDPLFAEGNKKCDLPHKVPCVDIDDECVLHDSFGIIVCHVSGCRETFSTVAEHAAHQRSRHSCKCLTCGATFPTPHLQDLHVMETHSTLFQVKAEKKPMYKCLLVTCSEIFNNPAMRKEHCMAVHNFPADFRYDLSWRKISKTSSPSEMECEGQEATVPESSRTLMSSNKRKPKIVPATFTFGSGVPRGFCRGRGNRGRGRSAHWHREQCPSKNTQVNIEDINMKELEKSLADESGVMHKL